jgi:adenine-specific DNA-methyltransferase
MAAPESVLRLVEEFREREGEFTRAGARGMNELTTREKFINKMFEALGWEVTAGRRPGELHDEVVLEDTLREDDNLSDLRLKGKRPDYSFRLGGKRQFFVEAKKPSEPLELSGAHAYQVRSYGWSAGLAVSVLTDFQELAIYDCNVQPFDGDPVGKARLHFYRYGEYDEKWEEIAGLLSKPAVEAGALARLAEAKPRGGSQTVDAVFLREISGWREELAKDINGRNPGLSERELNYAVQMTINRIIFLRICEDRGIERWESLMEATVRGRTSDGGQVAEGYVYRALVGLFRRADALYNSGLFDFTKEDTYTLALAVDDELLTRIIKGLYPPFPYRFDVMPVEILGQVYEQFLGKVIVKREDGGVTVEEKPEVRKAGGVYYTPRYIVDYIVEHTVGKLVGTTKDEGRKTKDDEKEMANERREVTPEDVAKLRIVDPACGSGSFLVGAYAFLMDWHLRYYMAHDPATLANKRKDRPIERVVGTKGAAGTQEVRYRLTVGERKRILLNNLYGVDIDSQAVEVTKLSLLLKVLEGELESRPEGERMIAMEFEEGERRLPDLGDNIKSGNSLIGPDFYQARMFDMEEAERVKPFDWNAAFSEIMKAGGFDVVIGNPPYIKEYTDRQPFHDLKGTKLYKYYQGKMDIWYIFACLSVDLLKEQGLHSFIATNNWITNSGASILRAKVLNETRMLKFTDFGDFKVFIQAGIQTMIYVLEKNFSEHSSSVDYLRVTNPKVTVADIMRMLVQHEYDPNAFGFKAQIAGSSSGGIFTFTPDNETAILDKIEQIGSYHLREADVAQGIVSPQDFVNSRHIDELKGENLRVGQGIFVLSGQEVEALELTPAEQELIKPYYTTHELGSFYGVQNNQYWIIYTTSNIGRRIDAYPNIKAHLDRFAPVITSSYGPYGLHRARDERFFVGEKIISLRKTDRPHFTYVDFPCYVSQTFNVIKPLDIDLKYLTGVLNSSLCHFWLDRKGKKQGDALQVDKEPLIAIPIRTIDLNDTKDRQRHQKMVRLVERMLEAHRRLGEARSPYDKQFLEGQIAATDREIDGLVYELYGLTEEEIGIVEGRGA